MIESILIIIFAGAMNALFVIPSRYATVASEVLWLYHTVFACLLMPFIFWSLLLKGNYVAYLALDYQVLFTIAFSGLLFGIGQITFLYAIRSLGISKSFAINLGLGAAVGSVYIVYYRHQLFTHTGFIVLVAVTMILIALYINYRATNKLIASSTRLISNRPCSKGWFFAIIAGIASGVQNIVFIITTFHVQQVSHPFYIWPLFLLMASGPMLISFFHRIKRDQILVKAFLSLFSRNIWLAAMTGGLFTGSLFLYSVGVDRLEKQSQIFAWPVFMGVIIFTTQALDIIYPAEHIVSAYKHRVLSMLLLLLAIVGLACFR